MNGNGMRFRIGLSVAILFLAVLASGLMCGCMVGGGEIGKFDHHAAVLRGTANRLNSSTMAQVQDPNVFLSLAVILENEARAAENFSAGLHGQAPPRPTPATRPSALPWVPKDANGN